ASTTVTAAGTPAGVPPKPYIDAGTVAAIGVAVGGISAALQALLQAAFGLGIWMARGILAPILLISDPSLLFSARRLRQRNLGTILDANGWAVNAKAKINIPFGGSLTHMPKLPSGSHREMVDPFAESHRVRNRTIAVLVLIAILTGLW